MELRGSSKTPISISTDPNESQGMLCCTGAAPRASVDCRTRMERMKETPMAVMARAQLALGSFQVKKTMMTAAITGMTGMSQAMFSITTGTSPLPFHQVNLVQIDLGNATIDRQD